MNDTLALILVFLGVSIWLYYLTQVQYDWFMPKKLYDIIYEFKVRRLKKNLDVVYKKESDLEIQRILMIKCIGDLKSQDIEIKYKALRQIRAFSGTFSYELNEEMYFKLIDHLKYEKDKKFMFNVVNELCFVHAFLKRNLPR